MNSRAQDRPICNLAELLASLAPGKVRVASSANVGDSLSQLMSIGPADLRQGRFIVLDWSRLPPHSSLLDESIDQLADAAQALWPQWYSTEPIGDIAGPSLELLEMQAAKAGLERLVMSRWLQLADKACNAGRSPRWPNEFTGEIECRQLGLALGEHTCRLVMAVCETKQSDRSLIGLARATEWVAREANLPVLLLVPKPLGDAKALDSINFGAVEFAEEMAAEATDSELQSEQAVIGAAQPKPTANRRCSRLAIHPFLDRPHPDSQGEQLLWAKLRADEELAKLFRCNQWAATVCGTSYLVDFVWHSGKLIVEVDGYYWHSSQYRFSFDRRRDFELHLSGHIVMRLPHDEVVADVESAVKKIRRMVQMRQQGGA